MSVTFPSWSTRVIHHQHSPWHPSPRVSMTWGSGSLGLGTVGRTSINMMTIHGCQPKNRGILPQNGWFIMETPIKIHIIRGYPYFWKHPHGNKWNQQTNCCSKLNVYWDSIVIHSCCFFWGGGMLLHSNHNPWRQGTYLSPAMDSRCKVRSKWSSGTSWFTHPTVPVTNHQGSSDQPGSNTHHETFIFPHFSVLDWTHVARRVSEALAHQVFPLLPVGNPNLGPLPGDHLTHWTILVLTSVTHSFIYIYISISNIIKSINETIL